MIRSFRVAAAGVAATFFAGLCAQPAHAGGMYATDRGARPLARGGAFVAGADDLHAIWYNPAGVREAGPQLLLDGAWVQQSAEYTRRVQVANSAGALHTYQYPTVSGSSKFLVIPTIAGSFNVGKRVTLAFGAYSPYVALSEFPTAVGGQPAASRYSLVSLGGSALMVLSAGGAVQITDKLRVGANLQALVGGFTAEVMFNANPADRMLGAPEDPRYDANAQLSAKPIFTPSANLGVTYDVHKKVRLGVSGQLPFWISAPATVKTRLPDVALFDQASQGGDRARIKLTLPAVLRAGVQFKHEWDKRKWLAVEFAYVREFWSMHDRIQVETKDVSLLNVTGFPSPFHVADIDMPRNFKDANSFRLGGEYMLPVSEKVALSPRLGVSFETAAMERAWVSPMTIDAQKFIASLGLGVHVGKFRLDATYARTFLAGIEVDPTEAKVPKVNPVQGNPVATEPINGGSYTAATNVFALGAQYRF